MKVVVNRCFGGFGLSEAAYKHMGLEWDGYGHADTDGIARTDPRLVAAVEELGSAANGDYANLVVLDIPDDVQWIIEEYDGDETVAEVHRAW